MISHFATAHQNHKDRFLIVLCLESKTSKNVTCDIPCKIHTTTSGGFCTYKCGRSCRGNFTGDHVRAPNRNIITFPRDPNTFSEGDWRHCYVGVEGPITF